MSSDELCQRIEALELKLMDMEHTIQQLNDVVLRQYRDIERLQSQQQELLNDSADVSDTSARASLRDELPPHY